MNFITVFKKDVYFFIKKNRFFLILYLIIFIIYFNFNQFQTIEDTTFNKSSDEWKFYLIARTTQASGFPGYFVIDPKYILNTIIINLSWFIADLIKIPDLFILAIIKTSIHIISVSLFYKITSLFFNKNISRISSLFFLFDPFILNLHFTLLRDDLIISLSFFFIYSLINIIEKKELNDSLYLSLFLVLILLLRPLHAITLLISTILIVFLRSKKIYFSFKFFTKIKYKSTIYFVYIIPFFIIAFSGLKESFLYGRFLLKNTSIAYIPVAFKNFYLSPLPGSVIKIISGEITSENYLNPYWALLRFILVIFTITFYFLTIMHKPYRIKRLSNPILLLSFFTTIFYGIFSLGSTTLGPRQGYFSYILILPLIIEALYLSCNSRTNKLTN